MAYFFTEDNKRIYYELYYGGSRDITVVLSHGWGMSSRVWVNTLSFLLDAGYSVLVYDQRACGKSDKDFRDVTIGSLGADLANLCSHLSLEKVVLNGWSLGGAVVVEAAAKMGRTLAGLVLTAGATPRYTRAEDFSYGGNFEDVVATVAAVRADRINFLKGLYFENVFAKDVGDEVCQWAWGIALEASPAADASLLDLGQIDQRKLMEGLSVSSLVVVGTLDGVADPDIGRYSASCLQNAHLVEMSGCGHAPFLEEADSYHKELLEYLNSL